MHEVIVFRTLRADSLHVYVHMHGRASFVYWNESRVYIRLLLYNKEFQNTPLVLLRSSAMTLVHWVGCCVSGCGCVCGFVVGSGAGFGFGQKVIQKR